MNYPLYNDKLSPIWNINEDGARLDPEIRKQLLKIAMDFVKDLKENGLSVKIEDVILLGSITNYNWTPYSDVDMHVVVDYGNLDMNKETAQTMFDAIKTIWNNKHNITMKGYDVELYVQDIDHEATSASEYSVLKNEWNKEPIKEKPNFNKALIKKKYNQYKNKIDNMIKGDGEKPLKDLLDKLYKFRQAGLDSGGELSEENIVFKMLRARGYIDKIKDTVASMYDDKMSVDEVNALVESRNKIHQYIKSIVPNWPDYVVRDMLYANFGKRAEFNVGDDIENEIIDFLSAIGLSTDTKWKFIPDMEFKIDMFDTLTKKRLMGRAGGHSDMGLGIYKDKERHATQSALAKKEGGVRKEPVILLKTPNGYELLEGWHRTVQHFAKYPEGYIGPAYVAVTDKNLN